MGNPLWKLDIETISTGQKPIATTMLTFRNRITGNHHKKIYIKSTKGNR
jgi:hypothetical protein